MCKSQGTKNSEGGEDGPVSPANQTFIKGDDGEEERRLTGDGESCVAASGLSGGVTGNAPVRAGITSAVATPAASAALRDSKEEERPIGQDQSMSARFQCLSFSIPSHLRRRNTVESATQSSWFVTQNCHVRRVVDNPRRDQNSASSASAATSSHF